MISTAIANVNNVKDVSNVTIAIGIGDGHGVICVVVECLKWPH